MSVRGRIFVFALLVLALVVITPAFAAEREKLGDANWTGPLETSNPNVIPKNHLYIETYFVMEQDYATYNNKGNKTSRPVSNDYQSVTLFAYGITNKFNLQFLPAFDGTEKLGGSLPGSSSKGLEVDDLTVRTPYQFYSYKEGKAWPSFTVSPGFIAPIGTGATNVTDPWTPWVGLWAQRPFWMPGGRILRVRFNENFYFPLQENHAVSACPTLTAAQLAAAGGACSLSGGKYMKTLIGAEYSLTKHWVPAWDFYWKWGAQTTTKGINGTAFTGGNNIFNSSMQRLVIDPALEYNFTGNVGMICGVELTVSGRNTTAYVAPQCALQLFK
jgi:hypothetical protein